MEFCFCMCKYSVVVQNVSMRKLVHMDNTFTELDEVIHQHIGR